MLIRFIQVIVSNKKLNPATPEQYSSIGFGGPNTFIPPLIIMCNTLFILWKPRNEDQPHEEKMPNVNVDANNEHAKLLNNNNNNNKVVPV